MFDFAFQSKWILAFWISPNTVWFPPFDPLFNDLPPPFKVQSPFQFQSQPHRAVRINTSSPSKAQSSVSQFLGAQLVIWNVGQGSWATEVGPETCLHFDMGGEKDPTPQVLALCRKKKNLLYLSHWDWDHLSFVRNFSSKVHSLCLTHTPKGAASDFKRKMIGGLPKCGSVEESSGRKAVADLFSPWKIKTANDASEVFYSRKFRVIFPGDSPKSQEKFWSSQAPASTRGLILGHHGSWTSTSRELLRNLRFLKWAVCSARSARYGHPHPRVLALLKSQRVPLLKTEDWGHLHFE